jgi:hypothetical protein
VRFVWQQRTIDEVRKINGCGEGKPGGEHAPRIRPIAERPT